MIKRDRLRLFDLALAREIIEMNRDELFHFVESREQQLRGMSPRRSVFIYSGDRVRTHTTEMVFDHFFNEDPAEVRQMLIEDLCHSGEPFELDYYARCGYLDDASSCCGDPTSNDAAISSDDLLPWPEDPEACEWVDRFDLLTGSHIALMSASLKAHRTKVADEEYTSQLLTLRSMEKTLNSDPCLRAAYFYR